MKNNRWVSIGCGVIANELAQALQAMRALLNTMDGRDSNVQTLRRQLNHMFPQT